MSKKCYVVSGKADEILKNRVFFFVVREKTKENKHRSRAAAKNQ